MNSQNLALDLSNLSLEEKRKLLVELLDEGELETPRFPQSFSQERLWLLEGMEANSTVYNVAVAFRFLGDLDLVALEKALAEIVSRHEVFRTSFHNFHGESVQTIHPDSTFKLKIINLQSIDKDDQETEAKKLAEKEVQTPFDLTLGSLFKPTLFQLSENHFILTLISHHIVMDRWSIDILLKEIDALYKAFISNQPSPLVELPIQYADFSVWQRENLTVSALQPQLSYWKGQFENTVVSLELPLDFPRSGVPNHEGKREPFSISPSLIEKLKRFSRQENATLFMTLFAGFQTLLYQYTGQEDILICSPFANRNRSELEGLVGYVNNVLPLRTDLSGNPSFKVLINRVRQVALGGSQHQDVPFQLIAEFPNLTRTPLTRAMFALQNTLREPLSLSGLQVSPFPIDKGTVNFELSLVLEEQNGMLNGMIEYKTNLFKSASILQLIEGYKALLELMVDQPTATLADLPRVERSPVPFTIKSPQSINPTEVPQNPVEKKLVSIWQDILNLDSVGVLDNFFELGGHSLLGIRLMERVQSELSKELPLVTLFQAPTIYQLARVIDPTLDNLSQSSDSLSFWPRILNRISNFLPFLGRSDSTSNSSAGLDALLQAPSVVLEIVRNRILGRVSPLVPLQTKGKRSPLFLVPGGPGVTLYLFHFSRYLPKDQPFYSFRAVAIDGKVEPYLRIEEMARDYITEIQKVQPHGPYLLAGHSYGGTVAFEIARQLWQKGEETKLLAIIDTPAPVVEELAEISLEEEDFNVLATIVEVLEHTFNIEMNLPTPDMFGMPYEQQVDRVIQLAVDLKLLPSWIGRHQLQGVARVFRASVKSQLSYLPEGGYPYPVTVIRADHVSEKSKALEHIKGSDMLMKFEGDPSLGWQTYSTLPVKVFQVQGDHFTMMTEPLVREVGKFVATCLDEIANENSQP